MFLQNISKFISNYRYEQATVESVSTVKADFLDFLGVTYRGMGEEASKIALNTVEVRPMYWNWMMGIGALSFIWAL